MHAVCNLHFVNKQIYIDHQNHHCSSHAHDGVCLPTTGVDICALLYTHDVSIELLFILLLCQLQRSPPAMYHTIQHKNKAFASCTETFVAVALAKAAGAQKVSAATLVGPARLSNV